MRKSKFSESQIVEILKDAESGVAVADLIRLSDLREQREGCRNSDRAPPSMADPIAAGKIGAMSPR